MTNPEKLRVVLFCGGRGSNSLINEFLRRNDVSLTLLVNAYDDGLSTGALRRFVPGMLGPSDFRKNLAYLIDLYSTEQYALRQLLECRLPVPFEGEKLAGFQKYIANGQMDLLIEPLRTLFEQLSPAKARNIRASLRVFLDYYENHKPASNFDFSDCAVGNLIFAGFYLEARQDFNTAIKSFAAMLEISADILNISQGEGYTLAGIKEDGQLLVNEESIVGPQSVWPIRELYFISAPPENGWEALERLSLAEKTAWLEAHERHPRLSPEVEAALAAADLIIYGPGTQHSSLLPSYRIVRPHLTNSPAIIKAFIVNLTHDHDIQGLAPPFLVDKALSYMGDPENAGRSITHIIYHHEPALDNQVLFDEKLLAAGNYKTARIMAGNFANAARPNTHNGHLTVRAILDILEESLLGGKPKLDIHLCLLKRDIAENAIIQEAVDLCWEEMFSAVTIHLSSHSALNLPPLPAYMRIEAHNHRDSEDMEADALRKWGSQDKAANYLAVLSGDGEYRLADVLWAAKQFKEASFGVVFGSRTQSRRQFLHTIRYAYGEGTLLYFLSWLGAFVVTALMGMRFGVIFSDPLTGFHVYRKDRLPWPVEGILAGKRSVNTVEILRQLLRANVEIAELPVTYKTFAGFTSPGWRFRRGLKGLLSFLR